jgi:hypothetical protein
MSLPRPPQPAKLVIGVLLRDRALFPGVSAELEGAFGAPDLVSRWFSFDYTRYYERELGAPLRRRVLAFKALVEQERLAEIKLATNAIEQSRAAGGRRTVNIDPGYLLLERFVLASGKNYAHRIYVGRGIYADLTLLFQSGDFRALPWTYPDYLDHPLRRFLIAVRQKFGLDVKSLLGQDAPESMEPL